jgi:hypothetical protein
VVICWSRGEAKKVRWIESSQINYDWPVRRSSSPYLKTLQQGCLAAFSRALDRYQISRLLNRSVLWEQAKKTKPNRFAGVDKN